MKTSILFRPELVRATLLGIKTETRRVITKHNSRSSYYVGQKLIVRETWRTEELENGLDGIRYKADNYFRPIGNTKAAADLWVQYNDRSGRWRPSIHMPYAFFRLEIQVTDIDEQRIQDISWRQCRAEGITYITKANEPNNYYYAFAELWDRINAPRGYAWASNPPVLVISYKICQIK